MVIIVQLLCLPVATFQFILTLILTGVSVGGVRSNVILVGFCPISLKGNIQQHRILRLQKSSVS